MKYRPNKSKLDYHFQDSVIPGCKIISATHPDYSYPIATIWYRLQNNTTTICILHQHTIPYLQRQGIMQYLYHRLVGAYKDVKRVVTDSGNRMSKPWLLKNKFKLDENNQYMVELKKK